MSRIVVRRRETEHGHVLTRIPAGRKQTPVPGMENGTHWFSKPVFLAPAHKQFRREEIFPGGPPEHERGSPETISRFPGSPAELAGGRGNVAHRAACGERPAAAVRVGSVGFVLPARKAAAQVEELAQ
jgi:hypothetical protein